MYAPPDVHRVYCDVLCFPTSGSAMEVTATDTRDPETRDHIESILCATELRRQVYKQVNHICLGRQGFYICSGLSRIIELIIMTE